MARAPARPHAAIALVLAAFTLLSAIYSLLVPFAEHPDEPFHLSYVVWVAQRWALPDAYADDKPVREAHQPPLYYALGAIAWSAIAPGLRETTALEDASLLARNPDFGNPNGRQNNRYLHLPDERWPFARWVASVQALRLALLPIALGVVASTYALALAIRPGGRGVALLAAASVAFLPQLVFLAGSITNDLLPVALSGLALVLVARFIRGGRPRTVEGLLLGAALAAGLLSKDTMLTVLPAAYLGIALGARRWRDVLRFAGLATLPIAAFYGPYVARGLVLYGSPLGGAAQIVTVPYMVHAARSPFSPYFLETAPTLWSSFVAHFGWLSISIGRPLLPYHAFAGLAALGVLAILWSALRGGARSTETKQVAVLLTAVLGALAGYVYHNLTIDSTQGRHLYTALPAIGVLAALGLERLAALTGASARLRQGALVAFLALAPAYALAVGLFSLLPVYGSMVLPAAPR